MVEASLEAGSGGNGMQVVRGKPKYAEVGKTKVRSDSGEDIIGRTGELVDISRHTGRIGRRIREAEGDLGDRATLYHAVLLGSSSHLFSASSRGRSVVTHIHSSPL